MEIKSTGMVDGIIIDNLKHFYTRGHQTTTPPPTNTTVEQEVQPASFVRWGRRRRWRRFNSLFVIPDQIERDAREMAGMTHITPDCCYCGGYTIWECGVSPMDGGDRQRHEAVTEDQGKRDRNYSIFPSIPFWSIFYIMGFPLSGG